MLAGRDQPDMAGYTELKYVMRCVNESMRLYPHPPVLLRRAEFADTLPGAALPSAKLLQKILPSSAMWLSWDRTRRLFVRVAMEGMRPHAA